MPPKHGVVSSNLTGRAIPKSVNSFASRAPETQHVLVSLGSKTKKGATSGATTKKTAASAFGVIADLLCQVFDLFGFAHHGQGQDGGGVGLLYFIL